MNIKNILLISFFLFVMPSLIVFGVETIFYTDVHATESDFAQKLQGSVKADPVTLVATKSDVKGIEIAKLNKVDAPHPLKYSYASSTPVKIERVNKKEEVKKEELTENQSPSAHPQVVKKSSTASVVEADLKTPQDAPKKEKVEEVKAAKVATLYSDEELEMLAKIIHAETETDTYEGKVAIGSVVLNRVQSDSFVNTIEGVILSKDQFSGVVHGRFSKAVPSPKDYEAAIEALNGFDPTGGALYYYSPTKTTSDWHESMTYLATVGNNRFFTNEKATNVRTAVEVEVEKTASKSTIQVENTNNEATEQTTKAEPASKEVQTSSKNVIYTYTADELEMLAKIIHAEAKGEVYNGKVAVGAVIINRLQSGSFSNTLQGVITAEKQFEPVANGTFAKAQPTAEDYEAAIESFNGVDPTGGATFFYAPSIVRSDFHESLKYTTTIGNHRFFRNEKAS